MSEKIRVYPLFLPHAGCRFRCAFCNQWVVTASDPVDANGPELISHFSMQLSGLVEQARRASMRGEIAFYGGTFTALLPDVIRELLDTASFWIREGVFSGIRFSTRPDAITPEICALLRGYSIQTIELGVQSLSDEVLRQSHRGYSLDAVLTAVYLLKQHPWKLGIQLMAGLPGETHRSFKTSISATIDLKPDFVRLYPTLVLPRTLLAEWYHKGLYKPLSLEDAVLWCASAYDDFLRAGIKVIRMGLHSDPELEKPGQIIAGPYHPAFGYLVRTRWWREQVDKRLVDAKSHGSMERLMIRVPEGKLSEVVGPRRGNVLYWRKKWGLEEVMVEGVSHSLPLLFECIVDGVSCDG